MQPEKTIAKLTLSSVLIKDEIQRSQKSLNAIREELRIRPNKCKFPMNKVCTKVNSNSRQGVSISTNNIGCYLCSNNGEVYGFYKQW